MAGVPSEATCSRTSLLIGRWRDTPGGIGTVGTVAAPDRVTDGRHEVDRRQRLHQVASHARRSAFLTVAAVPVSSDDSSGAANSLATAHEIWVTNPLLLDSPTPGSGFNPIADTSPPLRMAGKRQQETFAALFGHLIGWNERLDITHSSSVRRCRNADQLGARASRCSRGTSAAVPSQIIPPTTESRSGLRRWFLPE